MARFTVYSAAGVKKYEGAPVLTESYLKVSFLEFREVASPVPIEWALGDYVDYPRTGLRYQLYSIPVQTVRKQARRETYGAAFVYQNVQFYAPTKMLELAPFRDLVRGDNRIHFSTQNNISVWDDVYGIAERIDVAMNEMYPGLWRVQVVDAQDQGLLETLHTELNYSVEGVTCLGALDKIYELWGGIGWTYSKQGDIHVITIGGADMRSPDNTAPDFRYGKGRGLVTLERSISNRDSMATRLYVYGSNKNMLFRHYNNLELPIKEKESIDIQNLMLPVEPIPALEWGGWGRSGGRLYDASKAYIQNDEAIAKYGLLIKSVYFDGSENEDIFPTLKGITAAMIRNILRDPSAKYYPSPEIYADDERMDFIKRAVNPADPGSTSVDGSRYHTEVSSPVSEKRETVDLDISRNIVAVTSMDGFEGEDGAVSITPAVSGILACQENLGDDLEVYMMVTDSNGRNESFPITLTRRPNVVGYQYDFALPEASLQKGFMPFRVSIALDIHSNVQGGEATVTLYAGSVTLGLEAVRTQTFKMSLKQIGFDIRERAALGDGKATIVMTSGMCNGRTFLVKSCDYNAAEDQWDLTLWRQRDTSVDMWYPNADYPILEGDSFVLVDIAMPELYIQAAEQRLLEAGRKLLAELSRPAPVFTPKVDAKFVREYQDWWGTEISPLRSGLYLHIQDDDIDAFGEDYVLIDTVTINEGESNIPTYSITLREKKKVTIKESVAASSVDMSTSVADGAAVEQNGQTLPAVRANAYDIPAGLMVYTTGPIYGSSALVCMLYDASGTVFPADIQIIRENTGYGVRVAFDEMTISTYKLVVIG